MGSSKLTDKFDLNSLEQTKKQLLDIQLWATTQRTDDHQLYNVIDGLCRVAHMYNMVITQYVRDQGEISTADPQDYIDGKLSTPYAIYKRETDKSESLY
ncbi:hypothetical protein [Cytobacillus gottheilii]|uniref:hypothetical protein n=1 Tax=Cytobacillus gottheilii TaxID=859144 RepID=UPI0009B94C30|nr:hypothetical protein [Cytobacillus gottheilii]